MQRSQTLELLRLKVSHLLSLQEGTWLWPEEVRGTQNVRGLEVSVFESLYPPEPDIFLMAEGVCPNMTEGSPLQGVTEKQLPALHEEAPGTELIMWKHVPLGIFSLQIQNEVNPDSIFFSLSPFPPPNSPLSLSESFLACPLHPILVTQVMCLLCYAHHKEITLGPVNNIFIEN